MNNEKLSTFHNAASGLTAANTMAYLLNSPGETGGLAGGGFSGLASPFTSGATYIISVTSTSGTEGRYSIPWGAQYNGSASAGAQSNPDSAEDADDNPATALTLPVDTTADRTVDIIDDIPNFKSSVLIINIP